MSEEGQLTELENDFKLEIILAILFPFAALTYVFVDSMTGFLYYVLIPIGMFLMLLVFLFVFIKWMDNFELPIWNSLPHRGVLGLMMIATSTILSHLMDSLIIVTLISIESVLLFHATLDKKR